MSCYQQFNPCPCPCTPAPKCCPPAPPVQPPADLEFSASEPPPPPTPLPIVTLYNTGVDDRHVSLPPGSADPHYRIISSPGVATTNTPLVTKHPWAVNDAVSSFITRKNDSSNASASDFSGEYSFETTFDLSGINPSTVEITCYVQMDNEVLDVLINGVSTGITGVGVDLWQSPKTITSGFLPTLNSLIFKVKNYDSTGFNPMALRVRFDSISYSLGS